MDRIAKVTITEITPLGQGGGWKSWNIDFNKSQYTYTGKESLRGSLRVTVPPLVHWNPIKGDVVNLRMVRRNTWMPVIDDISNGLDPNQYLRDPNDATQSSFAGIDCLIYHDLDFAKTSHFEIKPTLLYFNPVTGEEFGEVLNSPLVDLSLNMPDKLVWSIWIRTMKPGESLLFAEFSSAWEAYKVYEDLNKSISVLQKLQQDAP